ncbi:MAG: T9SS type A sorting domain-containing protein [Bacteroidota bacterium]
MKKLLLALMLVPSLVCAQNNPFCPGTVDSLFYITEQEYFSFNTQTGRFDLSSRWTYDFEYIFDGNKNTRALLETWTPANGPYVNSSLVEFAYDSLGREVRQVVSNWSNNSWDSARKDIQSYGLFNGVEVHERILQFGTNGQWTNSSRTRDTSDINGNIVRLSSDSWGGSPASWDKFSRKEFTYSPTQKILESLEFRYNSSSMMYEPYSRETHTYDASDFLLETLFELWDTGASAYMTISRITYIPNTFNLAASALTEKWVMGNWENNLLGEYEYDSCGNRVISLNYFWLNNTSSWGLVSSDTNLYNPNGALLENTTFSFDSSDPNRAIVSGLKCTNNLLNVTHLEEDEVSSSWLIPNPIDPFRSLSLTGSPGVSYQLSLVDMQGRQVLSQTFNGSKAISISEIPIGLYILRISEKGTRVHTQKLWIK